MGRLKHSEYQYLDLLREVLEDGAENVDRGTGVKSLSVFGRQIRFDLKKGFPLLTTKRVFWKGVLHELYWFMAGKTNIDYLVRNGVGIWNDYPYKLYKLKNKKSKLTKEEFIEKIGNDRVFAKRHGELPRIYGEMWRRWPTKSKKTIDQLQWAIDELKSDPYARNAIVNSWNPEYLYSMAKRSETSHFPICHNMYQMSVKDGRLHLQLYQRSADLFLGVPFNIASYALLTIVVAKILRLQPGEFVHTFGDAHIYDNHFDQVKQQLKRRPKKLPKVVLAKSVKSLKTFTPGKVKLLGYEPHKMIRGKLTVSGGFYDDGDE